MYKITLRLSAALVCGCSPLQKLQTESHSTLALSDSLLTSLIREEFSRTISSLEQTVVEYYPPQPEPQDSLRNAPQKAVLSATEPSLRQPVKRVIRTEVNTSHSQERHTDSLSHSRINAAARNDEQSSLDEEANSVGSQWLKWAAACLLLVLLILITIKLR